MFPRIGSSLFLLNSSSLIPLYKTRNTQPYITCIVPDNFITAVLWSYVLQTTESTTVRMANCEKTKKCSARLFCLFRCEFHIQAAPTDSCNLSTFDDFIIQNDIVKITQLTEEQVERVKTKTVRSTRYLKYGGCVGHAACYNKKNML